MTTHIINSTQQAFNGVAKDAESSIAGVTQPSTKLSSFVIVIKAKFSLVLAKIAMSSFARAVDRCRIDRRISTYPSVRPGDGNHIRQREFIGLPRLFGFEAGGVKFLFPLSFGRRVVNFHIGSVLRAFQDRRGPFTYQVMQ